MDAKVRFWQEKAIVFRFFLQMTDILSFLNYLWLLILLGKGYFCDIEQQT